MDEKEKLRLAQKFREAELRYAEMTGGSFKPWFLSERDALKWEKEHPPVIEPTKPTIPYVYTPQDSKDLRMEFTEALGRINNGDEVGMSTSGNSVVVVAVGPMTLDVVEAMKKVFDKINEVG